MAASLSKHIRICTVKIVWFLNGIYRQSPIFSSITSMWQITTIKCNWPEILVNIDHLKTGHVLFSDPHGSVHFVSELRLPPQRSCQFKFWSADLTTRHFQSLSRQVSGKESNGGNNSGNFLLILWTLNGLLRRSLDGEVIFFFAASSLNLVLRLSSWLVYSLYRKDYVIL